MPLSGVTGAFTLYHCICGFKLWLPWLHGDQVWSLIRLRDVSALSAMSQAYSRCLQSRATVVF